MGENVDIDEKGFKARTRAHEKKVYRKRVEKRSFDCFRVIWEDWQVLLGIDH